MEISSGGTRSSIRIVVMEGSVPDVDDHWSPLPGRLTAISPKFLSHRFRRQRECGTTTPPALPTTPAPPELNAPGSGATDVAATSSNTDVGTVESLASSCRDVTASSQSRETLDRDDVTVSTISHVDAVSVEAVAAGSRSIDNSGDVSLATPTPTPTPGREDDDKYQVRFRFDSVSCADADKKDGITSSACPLPKEPHPVRDQTVRRRFSPWNDAGRSADSCSTPELRCNSIRLSLPAPMSARQLRRASSEIVKEDDRAVAPSRARWLFRRRTAGLRRGKPSSALKKEIKAARQLGVIMGAFTVCFLPAVLFPRVSTRRLTQWS